MFTRLSDRILNFLHNLRITSGLKQLIVIVTEVGGGGGFCKNGTHRGVENKMNHSKSLRLYNIYISCWRRIGYKQNHIKRKMTTCEQSSLSHMPHSNIYLDTSSPMIWISIIISLKFMIDMIQLSKIGTETFFFLYAFWYLYAFGVNMKFVIIFSSVWELDQYCPWSNNQNEI